MSGEKTQKLTNEIFLIMKTIPIGCLWLNKKLQIQFLISKSHFKSAFEKYVTLSYLIEKGGVRPLVQSCFITVSSTDGAAQSSLSTHVGQVAGTL